MTNTATLEERFNGLHWLSENTVLVGNIPVEFNWTLSVTENPSRLLILKHPDMIREYVNVFGDRSFANVLELGIMDGGSCVLLTHLLGAKKLVAIDLSPHSPNFDRMRLTSLACQTIRPYYNVSQDDETALSRILTAEFDGPPDLIIDDASHFLRETTRSFEILFPRLAPGGWYVIEDWSWAHFNDGRALGDAHSLAHLIFTLQIAWVSSPHMISNVVVTRSSAFIQKAATAPTGGQLKLNDLCVMGGREFKPF